MQEQKAKPAASLNPFGSSGGSESTATRTVVRGPDTTSALKAIEKATKLKAPKEKSLTDKQHKVKKVLERCGCL